MLPSSKKKLLNNGIMNSDPCIGVGSIFFYQGLNPVNLNPLLLILSPLTVFVRFTTALPKSELQHFQSVIGQDLLDIQ